MKRVTFKLVFDSDGTSYWTPWSHRKVNTEAINAIDRAGIPPDTNGWNERPEIPGFYDPSTIAHIVDELTAAGFPVTFEPVSATP
jgi:hypothetical protein